MNTDVYDDYLNIGVLEKLEEPLILEKPWYFGADREWSDKNRSLTLAHVIYRNDFSPVEHYFLKELSKNFDISRIGRCYYNCFRKCDKPEFHTDPGNLTHMFYLNYEWNKSWGGQTEFKEKKEQKSCKNIFPQPGRLVVFDANLYHRGTAPNMSMPDRIPGRLSIAFQEGR